MIKIKTITLRLDDVLHQEFKLHAVKSIETMQDMLIRLIKQELEQKDEQEEKAKSNQ